MMSKVHITLVGGQPIPVYLGIKYSKPDKVVFVCSAQSMDETKRIQHEFDIESEMIIFDPVNLKSIQEMTEALANKYAVNPLSINISSGTKPWSIYFTQIFGIRQDVDVFYIDQNNVIRNFSDFSQAILEIDMDTRFNLYGNPLTQYRKYNDYTEEDFNSIICIRTMRKFNFGDFNSLCDSLTKWSDRTRFDTKNGSTLEWDEQKKEIHLKMYDNKGNFLADIFNSPNARNLFESSGWFELEVAQLLNQWDKAKEVRINCIFPTKSNSPKNEIDIIVDTGTKLLFVECKTQIFKETDVDKFASAVKVYGGMGSKALFVTDATMRDKALEKCRDNQLLTFALAPNGGSSKAAKALFQLLDKELYNINTK
ncbi:MAG: hypothetical protein BGO29_14155 [Bacteroidales bacterium 36-12]|nr:MAG: hypothetical protein BGO29_14155 [Bacteroidales bacterium 36-12]